MLASGCIIKDKPEDADYVVEVRTGSLGTNRQDLLFGVPGHECADGRTVAEGLGGDPGNRPDEANQPTGRLQDRRVMPTIACPAGRSGKVGNRKIASRAKDTWLHGRRSVPKGHDLRRHGFRRREVPRAAGQQRRRRRRRLGRRRTRVPLHRAADWPEPVRGRRESTGQDSKRPLPADAAANTTAAAAAPARSSPCRQPKRQPPRRPRRRKNPPTRPRRLPRRLLPRSPRRDRRAT